MFVRNYVLLPCLYGRGNRGNVQISVCLKECRRAVEPCRAAMSFAVPTVFSALLMS